MNSKIVDFEISEISFMAKKPKEIFYIGKKELIKKTKVAIVGTRRPSNYTKDFTFKLAQSLAKRDIAIVNVRS